MALTIFLHVRYLRNIVLPMPLIKSQELPFQLHWETYEDVVLSSWLACKHQGGGGTYNVCMSTRLRLTSLRYCGHRPRTEWVELTPIYYVIMTSLIHVVCRQTTRSAPWNWTACSTNVWGMRYWQWGPLRMRDIVGIIIVIIVGNFFISHFAIFVRPRSIRNC